MSRLRLGSGGRRQVPEERGCRGSLAERDGVKGMSRKAREGTAKERADR
jgi:hypothetical protein